MEEFGKKLTLAAVLLLSLSVARAASGVAVVPATQRPPNDDCSDAQPIGDITNLAFDTTHARSNGRSLCMRSPNIWYCYTASCTGNVTVSLLGSSYDTMLGVYNGCDCQPTSSALIACNDDFGNQIQSQITFAATAGNQYLIEVGGYGRDAGRGRLTVHCEGQTPPPPPPPPPPPSTPPNNDCANAQPVGDVTKLTFDTQNATFDGRGLCMRSPNIWYCYTASCTGDVTVSLAGSDFDTMLAVYNECGCLPTSSALIACNDDFANQLQSQITFAATAGNAYLIEVGGYGSDTGPGVLTISCAGQPGSSSNDRCADARTVGNVTNLPFDTRHATFDGPGHCMSSPNLWYRYAATCTGQAVVSLCGSGFDTMLAVYKGWECYPKASDLVGCDDDACGRQSELTFDVVAGDHYLIEVGGYGNLIGQGVLSITCEEQAPADQFDLGDAPDSSNHFGKTMTAYPAQGSLPAVHAWYPTVFDDGNGVGPYGPVHVRPLAVAYLGEDVTWESEADTGPDQDGVNNIGPVADVADRDQGDDGVIFPVNMPRCRWTTFDYNVNVIQPGTDLWVNVWCDWNRDGDWDDTLECSGGPVPEWAVQNQLLFNLPAGIHKITTPAILSWHPKDGPKEMWMRITLSEQPWKGGSGPGQRGNGGSGPQEKYDIGETEDYYFVPDGMDTVCEDFNGDGVINIRDLVAFTTAWLENCPE
jgi:GEVED domain